MNFKIASIISIILLIFNKNVVAFHSTMYIENDTVLFDKAIQDNHSYNRWYNYFSLDMGYSLCSQTNHSLSLFSTDHLLNRFNVGVKSSPIAYKRFLSLDALLSYDYYNSFLYDSLQYSACELSIGQHYQYAFRFRHRNDKKVYRFYTKISYSFFPGYSFVEPISISVGKRIRIYEFQKKVDCVISYNTSFDIYILYYRSLNLFKTKVNNMSGFNISLQVRFYKSDRSPIYFQ